VEKDILPLKPPLHCISFSLRVMCALVPRGRWRAENMQEHAERYRHTFAYRAAAAGSLGVGTYAPLPYPVLAADVPAQWCLRSRRSPTVGVNAFITWQRRRATAASPDASTLPPRACAFYRQLRRRVNGVGRNVGVVSRPFALRDGNGKLLNAARTGGVPFAAERVNARHENVPGVPSVRVVLYCL